MMRLLSILLLLFAISGAASARLTIEITGGVEGAQPIAVVPFGQIEGAQTGVDIASVIAADLARTGRFKPMPQRDMMVTPHRAEEVDFREWELLATNNLVVGEVRPGPSGGYRIDYSLLDVFGGKKLLGSSLQSSEQTLRLSAHRIADAIYEKLTGDPGVFSTRIAYVTSVGRGTANERVTLRVADADGFNPQTIVDSPDPIMSPAWSPDGRKLAYVSFENRQSSIYVQELATGRRDKIASYPGINGSPAFSPDGSRMAMTLSKDGNAEVYIMNLGSRQLTRVTDHYAIDTEPAWSSDGRTLYFTSDRGGRPQIYRIAASGGAVERVSFEGDYNAAAEVAPNGRALVLVTRTAGSFRIAVDQLGGAGRRLLSSGPLDESPSFAPNGSMVIYASQNNGLGVLAVTPIAGGSGQRLTQDVGEVREPAWSPFLR